MSREFEPVSGECHRALLDHFIGDGYDSQVFRDGEKVKRAFVGPTPHGPSKPPTVEKLALYWEITNRASEMSSNNQFVFDFPFTKESYIFRVNPFLRMYKCQDCGFIEADSLYIPGNGLLIFSDQFDMRELQRVLKDVGYALEEKLRVKGLNLEPGNLKSPEEGLIVVTDLCSSISDLRRKW